MTRCEWCNEPFAPLYPDASTPARFCKQACRQMAWRAQADQRDAEARFQRGLQHAARQLRGQQQ